MWSYVRSAEAMLITSLTTGAAFVMNLTSAVIAIQIFGGFTAFMVCALAVHSPCQVMQLQSTTPFHTLCRALLPSRLCAVCFDRLPSTSSWSSLTFRLRL